MSETVMDEAPRELSNEMTMDGVPASEAPNAPLPHATSNAPLSSPVLIPSITVRTGRIVCEVAIPDERFRVTTPKLASFVTGRYPDLPHHACVNDVGRTFGEVIEATSLPHLLEHMAISEQVRNSRVGSTSATFIGTTEWVDEVAGVARVELGFLDDLDALRALGDATRFLNMAVITCLA